MKQVLIFTFLCLSCFLTGGSGTSYYVQRGIDYPGNDITAPRFNVDCAHWCETTSVCVGYVLSTDMPPTCWIKSAFANYNPQSTRVSYIRDNVAGYTLHTDVDYPGNDILDQDRPSPSSCGSWCSDTCRCVGFIWRDGHCWLKYGILQVDAVPYPSTLAYMSLVGGPSSTTRGPCH